MTCWSTLLVRFSVKILHVASGLFTSASSSFVFCTLVRLLGPLVCKAWWHMAPGGCCQFVVESELWSKSDCWGMGRQLQHRLVDGCTLDPVCYLVGYMCVPIVKSYDWITYQENYGSHFWMGPTFSLSLVQTIPGNFISPPNIDIIYIIKLCPWNSLFPYVQACHQCYLCSGVGLGVSSSSRWLFFMYYYCSDISIKFNLVYKLGFQLITYSYQDNPHHEYFDLIEAQFCSLIVKCYCWVCVSVR